MDAALLLGILQGLTEWLPISSQGVVALVQSALLDRPLSEAVAFALWLHAGTACAALLALRREAWGVLRDAASAPLRPSPRLRFLAIATVVSAVIGLPLLLALGELSESLGALGMGRRGPLDDGVGACCSYAVRKNPLPTARSRRQWMRWSRGWRRVWPRCRG